MADTMLRRGTARCKGVGYSKGWCDVKYTGHYIKFVCTKLTVRIGWHFELVYLFS